MSNRPAPITPEEITAIIFDPICPDAPKVKVLQTMCTVLFQRVSMPAWIPNPYPKRYRSMQEVRAEFGKRGLDRAGMDLIVGAIYTMGAAEAIVMGMRSPSWSEEKFMGYFIADDPKLFGAQNAHIRTLREQFLQAMRTHMRAQPQKFAKKSGSAHALAF